MQNVSKDVFAQSPSIIIMHFFFCHVSERKEVNKLLKNHKTIPQHIQSFLLPNNNGRHKCFTLSEKLPCKWIIERKDFPKYPGFHLTYEMAPTLVSTLHKRSGCYFGSHSDPWIEFCIYIWKFVSCLKAKNCTAV